MNLRCTWCRYSGVPVTNCIRSDPGVDVIPPAELQRRREFYLSRRRATQTDTERAEFDRRRGKEAYWETHKRLEHEWQDSQGKDWRERTYFVGGTSDVRLYTPIDRNSIPGGEHQICQICRDDLWEEGEAPIRLPCHASHLFHTECVDRWLVASMTCPTCRLRYTLSTYQEWEEVYDNRPFVEFFTRPQGIDAWLDPDVQAEWDAVMQAQQQGQ